MPDPSPPHPPLASHRQATAGAGLLTALATVLMLGLVAGWLPHYLTWPWWTDLDTHSTLALGWDHGILPYRDVVSFNFPGQFELLWLLGHLVGWGRPAVPYAFDAALLLGFVGLLIVWSRRRLGSSLPGLIGALALLRYYLDQDYSRVLQRDSQAAWFALASVLVVQGWPPRRGARFLAGGLLGLALAIRPHAIVYVPCALLAVLDAWHAGRAGAEAGRSRFGPLGPLLGWGAGSALVLACAFAPLAWAGLLDDLVRGIRQAGYNTGYSSVTPRGILTDLLRQLCLLPPVPPPGERPFEVRPTWLRWVDALRIPLVLIGLLILAARRGQTRGRRGLIAVWALMLLLVLAYAPLHPKPHRYLEHPRNFVLSVALAVLSAGVLQWLRDRPRAHTAAALLLLWIALLVPTPPRFWNPGASLAAPAELTRPGGPLRPPPGVAPYWAPLDGNSPYLWDDYRRTLAHLRQTTGSDTVVANLLRNVPFPTLNGPLGRVSTLGGESGLPYLWLVDPGLEPAYAEAVAVAPPGSVVVWDPDHPSFHPNLALPTISRAVRTHYRPEARFGPIEVWRKP